MCKLRKKLCIAGGDARMHYAAERLAEVFDVSMECTGCDRKMTGRVDILLLPPVTTDSNGEIYAPLSEKKPDADRLLESLKTTGIVLAGVKSETIKKKAEERGITIINYMKDEILAVENAVPTAEGAILTAIEKTGRTIWGSRVLVTGFGRTGTALAERLVKLGAYVTAAARKEKDRMRITGMGAQAISFEQLENVLADTDIIFNTVPSRVFTEEDTEKINSRCTYIELASLPYGADPELIKGHKAGYVCASGLPAYGSDLHKKV